MHFARVCLWSIFSVFGLTFGLGGFRSLIGKYYFPCLGANEKTIEAAGLSLLETVDTTAEASVLARRWHDSRAKHRVELQEPEANFNGLQEFLWSVHSLLAEGKLSREMYVAEKK